MSSTNKRRLGKVPPKKEGVRIKNRAVQVTFDHRDTPDAWLLARALLGLAAHRRQQQERAKPSPATPISPEVEEEP